MGTHIALGSEAGTQVCLYILHRDKQCALGGLTLAARLDHVLVRVDQARQNGRIAEIDYSRAHRYLDLRLRTDLCDALTGQNDRLPDQQLASFAVEQTSCANRNYTCRGWALQDAAFRADAWDRPRPAPTGGMHLRPNRAQHDRCQHG